MAYTHGDKKSIFPVSNNEVKWLKKATDQRMGIICREDTGTFGLEGTWYRRSRRSRRSTVMESLRSVKGFKTLFLFKKVNKIKPRVPLRANAMDSICFRGEKKVKAFNKKVDHWVTLRCVHVPVGGGVEIKQWERGAGRQGSWRANVGLLIHLTGAYSTGRGKGQVS